MINNIKKFSTKFINNNNQKKVLKLLILVIINIVYSDDCSSLLSKPKPSSALGYKCKINTSTTFSSSYVANYGVYSDTIDFKIQGIQGTVRQPCANLIQPANNQQYQIGFDFQGNDNQYLDSVYISYDLYYLQPFDHYRFMLGWYSDRYYTVNYPASTIQHLSVQESGCSPNYYHASQLEMVSLLPNFPQSISFSFEFTIFQSSNKLQMASISNIIVLAFYQCPIGCSGSCPGGACQRCLSGYNLQGSQCILQCNSNQYVLTDASSQQSCQPCMANCLSCSNGLTCNQCSSNSAYVVVNGQNQCQLCFNSCQTCLDGQSTSCLSCKSGYYSLSTSPNPPNGCFQTCPNNYQLNGNTCQLCNQAIYISCLNCPNTCRSCTSMQSNTCTDCYPGMQINTNTNQCQCISDPRNLNFYYCSYNNIAVVQATFSSSNPILTLEFGLTLTPASILCNQIFDSSTLALLGSSTCTINASQVVVSLSQDAQIMVNNTITLTGSAQVLQFNGSLQKINKIYLISVVQQPASPVLAIQYNQLENYCNDIVFQIQNITNDAGRGLFSVQWILLQQQTFDQQTQQNLNAILQSGNSEQIQTLTIPKYTIPPNTSITIQLVYMFKVYTSNT
ncbi:hypothetical protein ABPG72_020922 [Tetrahymena utriculariae]